MAPRQPIAYRTRRALPSRESAGRRERRIFFRPVAVAGTEVMVARRSPVPSHVYLERYAVCVCPRAIRWPGVPPGGALPGPDASSVWMLQPGQVHQIHKIDSSASCANFNVLFIEPALIERAARQRGLPEFPGFPAVQIQHVSLFTAVCNFCAAVEEAEAADVQRERFSACLNFLLELMNRKPAGLQPLQSGVQGAVARARDLLRRRFNESVPLDELVKVSGLSRFHLVRCFAEAVGLTPHAYQIRLRIEHAMARLREGLEPGVVASLVGFADQSHLTRHFRRILRVTPGRYADASRRSD